jgi:adenylyltransferase/sulfurtransferase
MALEAIKVLSGLGKPLSNKLLLFNSLDTQFQELEINPNPTSQSAIPTSWNDFHQRDYTLACEGVQQLTWNEAMKLMGQEVAFVDVREPGEEPPLECTGLVKVPFSTLSKELDRFEEAEEILCFCQSGVRSQKAAQLLQETYPDKKIFSIRGGIQALKS